MAEATKHNPNQIKMTKRGKIAGWVTGIGVASAAGFGIGLPDAPETPSKDTTVCFDTQNTKEVVVKNGDGINDIVTRAYGVEDGVVQNNVCYDAEVKAVEDQVGEGNVLQPGVIHLPIDVLPEDQLTKK